LFRFGNWLLFKELLKNDLFPRAVGGIFPILSPSSARIYLVVISTLLHAEI